MKQLLEVINNSFSLVPRDVGEFAAFKAPPMKITLESYSATGLGSVSYVHGTAMAGLMKMDTLVINAVSRDVPLFSCDLICAMGKYTLLVEYYDTLLDAGELDMSALSCAKEQLSHIPDHPLGEHWYDPLKLAPSFSKKAGRGEFAALSAAVKDALTAYAALAKKKPELGAEAAADKLQKSSEYVNGLLEHGGPSTDAFTKAIGAQKTRELFERFVFATRA